MQVRGRPAVEPLDADDIELLRYMRRSFDCRGRGADCPAAADCPEGFYICDAIVNMVSAGTRPELGPVAQQAVRHLYWHLDCGARGDCPADARCAEGSREPCRMLLLKLGVAAS